MTSHELHQFFNKTYGISKEWPKQYKVDSDTYANVCQAVFTQAVVTDNLLGYDVIQISIGPNKGIMFRNVELINKKGRV